MAFKKEAVYGKIGDGVFHFSILFFKNNFYVTSNCIDLILNSIQIAFILNDTMQSRKPRETLN